MQAHWFVTRSNMLQALSLSPWNGSNPAKEAHNIQDLTITHTIPHGSYHRSGIIYPTGKGARMVGRHALPADARRKATRNITHHGEEVIATM